MSARRFSPATHSLINVGTTLGRERRCAEPLIEVGIDSQLVPQRLPQAHLVDARSAQHRFVRRRGREPRANRLEAAVHGLRRTARVAADRSTSISIN